MTETQTGCRPRRQPPHAAVTVHVPHLAELAWIAEKAGGPAWFLNAVATVPAIEGQDDGESWLDFSAVGEYFSHSEVPSGRKLPPPHSGATAAGSLDEILCHQESELAMNTVLDRCERSTHRWAALAAALAFDYDDEKITLGQRDCCRVG
ncbi:hypothetical protein ACGFZU_43645 [Streptomyces tendae]|uniref:hypothetical protein n=1 Tax=Streptomyces tendae TaxID=1932 RepID=UPI00371B3BA7